MTKHEYHWAPGLPYMEVRRFIAERLRTEPPSFDLNIKACEFLGLAVYSEITQNLECAVAAIPDGWWWHLSHLEAQVIPTNPVAGAPLSNSTLYDLYGRPVGFSAMCWDRAQLPAALCEALLKARYDLPNGFVVEASKTAHNDMRKRMARYRRENFVQPAETSGGEDELPD